MNRLSTVAVPDTPLTTQRGAVIWLFGLSGSGKSTIAAQLAGKLRAQHFENYVLDGDLLRLTVNSDLGFSPDDRSENIRRAAVMAQELAERNMVVICSFITPLNEHRLVARRIVKDRYYEVFVDCPLWLCEQRDVKGLYRKARNREIDNFTGISATFEPSVDSWLHLHTDVETESESVALVMNAILPHVTMP